MTELFPEKQLNKLHTAVDWSISQLEVPRTKRVEAVKDLVGKHYMAGGSDRIMPVNATKMALDIYVRYLAARNPRGLFSAKYPEFVPTAKNFELAVNQIPDEIGLGQTLRQIITESIVSPMGIAKCGLSATGSILGHAYGEPFVDCITLDDYFCDLSARNWEQVQFEGNDYWMEFEDFKEWIPSEHRKDVRFDSYEISGEHGEVRANSLTANSTADVYRERIWLRDVWLPKERILLTYGIKSKKLFNVVEYDDDMPEPYIKLGYTIVPGNLLPLPPVASWRDLNELGNALFRKLGASADAYKEVLNFAGGDDEGVNAFKMARHGDGINTGGMKQPEKWSAGGIEPKALVFYQQVKELFSYFAGNVDSLGGLAQQTQTIGQDRLLAESAGAQLRDMSDQVIDFVRKIFKALAYYEWTNPVKTRTIKKDVAGQTIDVEWNQDTKKGNFDYYDIDIDVYKMQDDSPGLRLQKLGAVMQQYVLPLMPVIQQNGGNFDVEALIKTVAKYASLPELETIVTFPDDPVPQQQASGSTQQYIGAPRTPQNSSGQGVASTGMSSDMMSQLLASE
jgi:hypothetical protein